MSESEKKKMQNSHELSVIQEGEAFKSSVIPKVVNIDAKLKDSYPEGFFEQSKNKKSARKSTRKDRSTSKNEDRKTEGSRKSKSGSKSKKNSARKSAKKDVIDKKSGRKRAEAQE